METGQVSSVAVAPLPLLSRIRATFLSPRRLAAAVLAEPRALGALLIFLILWNVLAALTFDYTLDMFVDQIYEMPNVPSDQQETIATWIEDHRAIVQTLHHVGLTLSWAAALLLWAGLLLLSSGLFFETPAQPVTFRHMFSLACHANLVNIPHAIITTVATLATQEFFRSVSLGALLGIKITTPMGTAAEWLTPFNLWWIAILGVGCAVFYGQSWRRAVIVPLGVSLVFRIIQVAMTAFGSAGPR